MEDKNNNQIPTPTTESQNLPETTAPQPEKHSKRLILIFLCVFILVTTAGIVTWLFVFDSNEDQAVDNQQASIADLGDTEDTISPSQLPASDYLGEYTLEDEKYGTMTEVKISEDSRIISSNALPNHETGEFPNDGNPNAISAQDKTWTYPLNPTFIGKAVDAREPGVAINGVKFEPGTAERATCNSGETYSIEALQDITDLGLDLNNAHVQPGGEYHYHGVSSLLVSIYDQEDDLVHVGFAADGYLIYYSKSGAYTSSYKLGNGNRAGTNCSYSVPGPSGGGAISFDGKKDGSLTEDWEYSVTNGDLDECNGITIGNQYVYILTNEFPYVPRCLKGEFTESAPSGIEPGAKVQNNQQQLGPQNQTGPPPMNN